MSKVLKTVAIVVGAAALVATGIGLAIGGAAVAGGAAGSATFLGIAGTTWATIGAVAGVVSGILTLGSALMAPKPKFSDSGNPQQFTTNPQSGLPYNIGRTAFAGLRIAGKVTNSPGWDKKDILCFAVMLSCGGSIFAYEKFTADNVPISFGPTVPSSYYGWMEMQPTKGEPGRAALSLEVNGAQFPEWTSAHKLTGISHALWMMRYDTDGNHYSGGVPQPRWIAKWVLVYDPRLDSTYPGGSGACRALDETTYVWSRNPALHALTWCLGRYQNGKRTVGIGAPVKMIRVADFVQAANVADVNGWGAGGTCYSTDSKWGVLKNMLQAGGAVPTMTAAMIGCRVNMPRVSIATIESAEILDSLSIATTKSRRERINTIRPRFRDEANDWEVVTGSAVSVPAYVTADGGERARELDLPLVQNEIGQTGFNGARQAGELAMYEIVNAREAGPITFSTGPARIGLRNGDCITLNVPEEGLSNTKVLLTSDPVFDPATGKFQFTCETETDGKHDLALGKTSTPPPPFTPYVPDFVPPQPGVGVWTLSPALNGDGLPMLVVSGATGPHSWDALLIQYRKVGAASWTFAGSYRDPGTLRVEIPGVDGGETYEAQVAYASGAGAVGPWRDLASVATGQNALSLLIADAQATADAKRTIFYRTTAPSHLESEENDLWINPADGNRLYRRVAGTGRLAMGADRITLGGNPIVLCWTPADDQRIAQALLDAAGAQGTADGKVESFTMFSATDPEPLGTGVGDLLYRLYTNPVSVWRWDGSTWVPLATYGATAAQIALIGQALTDAANAQAVADGKIDTFYQASAPTGASLGDLWFDTDDGNKQHRFNGLIWEPVQDVGIGDAITAAAGAQATADGKVTTFIGESVPTAEGIGDLWYKESTKVLSRWNGTDWVPVSSIGAPDGTNVGTTPATTVEQGANAANNGVNPDGTIKDDKVDTPAIVPNAITVPVSATLMSDVTTYPGNTTTLLSITRTKETADSILRLTANLAVVTGDDWNSDFLIESTSGSTIGGVWTPTYKRNVHLLLGGTNFGIQLPVTFTFHIEGWPAGSETWLLKQWNLGGASVGSGTVRASSTLQYEEMKK